MINFKHIPRYAFFCMFLAVFIVSNNAIKNQRKHLSTDYALNLINLPPKAIRFFSGGFNGIMSDYILMQLASFAGSGKILTESDRKKLLLGFDQVMELDPYFEQTYLQAQSAIAWDAKMPLEAIRLLDTSRKARSWDFRPGFYMGFNYYFFLDDNQNAASVFAETSKIKNAPVLITLLASRFAVKSKRTEASLQMLLQMQKNPDLDEIYQKEIGDRIVALKGVLILEKAISLYKKQYGDNPENLEALVHMNVLNQLPENPYKISFRYNREDNQVVFDQYNSTSVQKRENSDTNLNRHQSDIQELYFEEFKGIIEF